MNTKQGGLFRIYSGSNTIFRFVLEYTALHYLRYNMTNSNMSMYLSCYMNKLNIPFIDLYVMSIDIKLCDGH